MRLQSLDIHGFKTFPEKTKLNFNHGFTAVVGPNGSGKSNISDAIRWVLGEQSTKNLRCSKMEDIVFNGTPSRKPQGYAEVTLTMENEDRKLNFDCDLVAVTRRYYRSGDSEYAINKASVRLKDIHELFMDTGIGRDGYSMIGQGKIDSIVSARSEDRREIFEEAAGVSRYRYRKEESERKLLHAEENLVRLWDILSELEGRVEPLRVQAEKAKSYLTYYDEKRNLEIGLWLNTLSRSGKILREQEEKNAIAKNQEVEVNQAIEEIATEIEESFTKSNQLTMKMDELRLQAAKQEETVARKEGDILVLENDILHNTQTINRFSEEVNSLHAGIKNAEQVAGDKQKLLAVIESKKQMSQKAITVQSEKLAAFKSGISLSSGEIEQLSQTLAGYNEAHARYHLDKMLTLSAIEETNIKLAEFAENEAEYYAKEAIFSAELTEKEQKITQIERKITAQNTEVTEKEEAVRLEQMKMAEAKKRLETLSLDIGEESRKIRLLQQLEGNLEGFMQSVKVIMKEVEAGKLTGVCGPVSRLIDVPKETALAIETALGGSMQHIVVQTETDAKKAISFLKTTQKGRATFLPIATVKGYPLSAAGIEKENGFIGIAADLCSAKDEYHGILLSLLGRIVIVKDLDCAAAIAKKYGYKFRIVTLDGQVVNAGGSMTGGSFTKNSGLLSRATDIQAGKVKIERLTKQLQTQEADFEIMEINLSAATLALKDLQNVQFTLKEALIHTKAEFANSAENTKIFKQSYQNMQASKEAVAKKLADLTEEAKLYEEKQSEQTTQIENMKAELQRQSQKSHEKQQNAGELAEELQELRINELTLRSEYDGLQREIFDLQSSKEGFYTKLLSLQTEYNTLEQTNELLRKQIEEIKAEVTSLISTVASSKVETKDLSAKRMELEQISVKLRTKEREKSAERENLGREIARLEERKLGLQKEYDTITAKLWEDYELTRKEAEAIGYQIQEVAGAQKRLAELKQKIKALGTVNVESIEEYKEVAERYGFMKQQVDDVEKSRSELKRMINDLTKQMKEVFLEQFEKINYNFCETFQSLFGGGKASLVLENPEDILQSGIQIVVHPPGKIVSNLELLSGGEKAMVAIALYFGIMRVSPPPFCLLDEIDAALDDVNVMRYIQYLKKMNKHSQFIAITHRRGTMEGADVLYGVTMQDEGVSKLLELNASEAHIKLGIKA